MTRSRVSRALRALAVSAGAAALTAATARRLPPAARAPFERTNHSGATVTLLEGPAYVVGSVAGALATGAGGPAAALAAATGVLGALDDHVGTTSTKGLRGHLGALSRGEVTTGALKIVGLGVVGLLGAALVDRRTPRGMPVLGTLVGGAVVAGAANAANLFDLRPGRALKVVGAAGLPVLGTTAGAAAVGAGLGVVRDDLAGRSMLGDTGANTAGALVGLALVERLRTPGRLLALGGLAALTLASERVSFTKVIERTPALRRLDEWGRPR